MAAPTSPGFDDGTREVPGPLALAFNSGRQIQAGPNYTNEQLRRIGQSLVNAPLRLLQSEQIPVNVGLEASGGFSHESPIGTLGVILSGGTTTAGGPDRAFRKRASFPAQTSSPRLATPTTRPRTTCN